MTETTLLHPIVLTLEPTRKQTKNQVDMTIVEAVDESLSSFGESVKQVVYYQLENSYHVSKQDIPRRIEEFVRAVEGIFGVGAGLIEMRILETLYARTGGFAYVPEGGDLVFKDYVRSVRSYFQ
jgi:hypothetical protein